MKKIFYLITIIISMLTVNVYASNTADYTLTITDNFKKEIHFRVEEQIKKMIEEIKDQIKIKMITTKKVH